MIEQLTKTTKKFLFSKYIRSIDGQIKIPDLRHCRKSQESILLKQNKKNSHHSPPLNDSIDMIDMRENNKIFASQGFNRIPQ